MEDESEANKPNVSETMSSFKPYSSHFPDTMWKQIDIYNNLDMINPYSIVIFDGTLVIGKIPAQRSLISNPGYCEVLFFFSFCL